MGPWDDEGENTLWLFTPVEYEQLPEGIELESINGEFKTKGIHYIDQDTRFGHLAYGVRNPLNHKEKNLFLMFGLKQ